MYSNVFFSRINLGQLTDYESEKLGKYAVWLYILVMLVLFKTWVTLSVYVQVFSIFSISITKCLGKAYKILKIA